MAMTRGRVGAFRKGRVALALLLYSLVSIAQTYREGVDVYSSRGTMEGRRRAS